MFGKRFGRSSPDYPPKPIRVNEEIGEPPAQAEIDAGLDSSIGAPIETPIHSPSQESALAEQTFGHVDTSLLPGVNPEESVDFTVREADRIWEDWSNRRLDANVFSGNVMKELWKARQAAVAAAEAYAAAELSEREEKLELLVLSFEAMNSLAPRIEEEMQELIARREQKIMLSASEDELLISADVVINAETAVEALEREIEGTIPPQESTEHQNAGEQSEAQEVTPREHKQRLFAVVQGFESEKEANVKLNKSRITLSPFKTAMQNAEEAYTEAYKEFHATKGLLSREPEELKQLEAAYLGTRAAYAAELNQLSEKRLENRNDLSQEQKNVLLARYDRIVRFKEIVKPAAEKKYEARAEALSTREKGMFARGLSWLATKNQKLEEMTGGKIQARVVRAAATTVAIGGAAALAGALGSMGIVAALGWGTWRIGKVVVGGTVGAALGELTARIYKKQIGERAQDKASEELRAAGRLGTEADDRTLSIEALREFDTLRSSLLKNADEKTVARNTMIVRAVASALFGAGVAAALPDSFGGTDRAPDMPDKVNAGEKVVPAVPTQAEEVVSTSDATQEAPTPASEVPPADAPPPTVNNEVPAAEAPIVHEALEGSVINKGEGADSLFYDLKQQLEAKYGGDLSKVSPAERSLLSANNPHVFARSFGFTTDTESRIMHAGDTLEIDKQGQLVFHDSNTGKDTTLIDYRGQVTPKVDSIIGAGGMLPNSDTSAPAAEQTVQKSVEARVDAPVDSVAPVPPAEPGSEKVTEPLPKTEQVPEAGELAPTEATTTSETSVAAESAQLPKTDVAEDVSGVDESSNDAAVSEAVEASTENAGEISTDTETTQGNEVLVTGKLESFINPNGVTVNPNETHLYAVPSTDKPGTQALVAYGLNASNGKSVSAAISELAEKYPPKTIIYYQSPTPLADGRPWVDSYILGETSMGSARAFSLEGEIGPEFPRGSNIGVTINPDAFTKLVK